MEVEVSKDTMHRHLQSHRHAETFPAPVSGMLVHIHRIKHELSVIHPDSYAAVMMIGKVYCVLGIYKLS